MARPSLSDVRQTQILEAFVSCVASYGLQGSTQERIAEKAGVKRTILRHYLGNKEEMMDSLVEHVVARYDEQLEQLKLVLPKKNRAEALVQIILHGGDTVDIELGLAFQALVIHFTKDPRQKRLEDCVLGFFELVETELSTEYPKAEARLVKAVTMTIISLHLAQECFAPFGHGDSRRQEMIDSASYQLKLLKGGSL